MRKIAETAAGGSTGAGSIATVPSNRLGGMQTRMSLVDFMKKFYGRMNNRNKFHPFKMEGSIHRIVETAGFPYQLDDATSRMKSMQMQGEIESYHKETDVITYGIEDDEGSLMKVTVPIDQGEEFERHVAQSLADVMDFKKTGHGEDKTLAELLYELKDQFTIINAEFPQIPKDAIYNASEITEDLPDGEEGDDADFDGEEGDDADFNGDGGDIGDEEGDGLDFDGEGDDEDSDLGVDFEDGEESEESLLKSILGMLKSQAERDIAQANAEAEKAKAKQAELALSSSQKEMSQQEEMVAAEAELDAEKEREKKAKKMAELAKYNIKKRRNEGFSPLFREALDPNANRMSVQRDRMNIQQTMKADNDASPEDKAFIQRRKQQALRINQIEMRAAMDKKRHEREQQMKDREQEQDPNQDPNQDQNQDQNQDRSARQPRGPQ